MCLGNRKFITGHKVKKHGLGKKLFDEGAGRAMAKAVERQQSNFVWKGVTYEIRYAPWG